MMFPRWLSILFVLFLGYLLVVANQHAPAVPAPAPAQSGEAPHNYAAIHALMDGDRWRRAINPAYQPLAAACPAVEAKPDEMPSYAIIEQPGEGAGLRCGDSVKLQVTRWDAAGQAIKPVEVTLKLGEQKGLDVLLLGMMPGEKRTLILHVPKEGYKALPQVKSGMQLLTLQSPGAA